MIENSTGLPALPDGQFWRVRKNTSNLLYSTSDFCLCIMERIPCPPFIDEPNPAYRWWNLESKKVRRASNEEDGLREIDYSEIYHWLRDDEISEQELNDLKVAEKRYYKMGGPNSLYTRHPRSSRELTKLNILRTAERMIAARDEKARIAGLLGDYPPKSLPAGDSND